MASRVDFEAFANEISSSLKAESLLVRAADVAYQPPRWLIKPYFQLGKGTLIQGDNGCGKTAFACAIAAHVSTGEPLLGMDLFCQWRMICPYYVAVLRPAAAI